LVPDHFFNGVLPEDIFYRDDGAQAMERLKSIYLLASIVLAAVLAAVPAMGQQAAPHDPLAGTVAVVGDVGNCNTYPVPTGTTLTVRQAVINAGLLSESVNVTVIRKAQDRPQWTQPVSATSTDNGEPVERGDVLVVQAMSPLTAAVRKNAALRSNSGVVVVSLEQDGIVIGDVLEQTNNPPPTDGQLRVICRFPGQTPISKAELYHPIAHGDVISISRNNRTVPKGFGSMSPTVSEWKSGGAAAARDPFMPDTVPLSNSTLTGSPSIFQSSQLPTTQEPLMILPVQDGESPKADNLVSDLNGKALTDFVPAISISQSEDVADAGAADNRTGSDSESMSVAPIAPPEIQLEAVTNPLETAFNPWNLVFIGGLLLAGTLILAGTLKPEPDDNTEFSSTSSSTTTSDAMHVGSAAASRRMWTESPRPGNVAMPLSKTSETLAKNEPEIRVRAGVRAAKALVAGHEWFSGDWHGQVVSSAVPSQGETLVALPGNERSEPVSEVLSVKTLSADEQSFSDFEDLLQNRLPIDLCEVQFPLRAALFGKPKGPRRLRIDAAHAAIPAPHMNLSSVKRRELPPVAANVAAGQSAVAHMQPVAESSGSLDRALHFMQERTES